MFESAIAGAAASKAQEERSAASSRRLHRTGSLGTSMGSIGSDMLHPDNSAAVDHEGFRHSRRAEGKLELALRVGADPLERVAVLDRESERCLRAGRGRRCPRSARPARSSSSSGASAMHGTHQLAKMLTSLGLPSARSAEVKRRLSGQGRRRFELRNRLSDQRRLNGRVGRVGKPPDHGSDNQRQKITGRKRGHPLIAHAPFASPARLGRQARAARRARSGRRPARAM
jgi:hypothetical protein